MLFSVVTPQVKDVLMRELVDTMRIDRPGSGIAVCLHLSSVGGRTALNYLISGKSDAQPDMTVKEEEQMNENAYQLIVAITNTGYTDAGMEAASVCASVWAPAFSMMDCMMAARLSAGVTSRIISRSSVMAMPKNLLALSASVGGCPAGSDCKGGRTDE